MQLHQLQSFMAKQERVDSICSRNNHQSLIKTSRYLFADTLRVVMETCPGHSPTEHDYEVHDVPAIPQVRTFMENKTKRH